MTEQKYYMKLSFTSKYGLIGAVLGYFVIHPLVMISSHIMFEGMFDHTCTLAEFILAKVLGAFSLKMLLWSLSSTTFCALIGYFYGRVKQNEKALHEANATKDKFFSILAHDLKTPLVNLLGLSDLLLEKYERFDEEKKKRYIHNMYSSSKRLHDLVEDLLTWARAQTGKIEWNPAPIDLAVPVNESIFLLKANAEGKEITVHSAIQEHTMVYADARMVLMIIRNLVSNAIKFTPKGGEVEIHSKTLGSYEQITIADTGIGIPQAEKHKLFQLDSGYSTPGTAGEQGTGLGLVLCKEFVEKHGGKIWVESDVGKGSQFLFTLPRHKP